jgi:hypothetical protein
MVKDVPPVKGPLVGFTAVTVTAAYVKPPVKVAVSVGVVTVTSFAPAVPAGAVAVMVVLFTIATFVAETPPILTVLPVTKPTPVIVTVILPATGP